MIKVITLNPGTENYILNDDGERVSRIDEAGRIVFKNINGSPVIVNKEDLRKQFCGMYFVNRPDNNDETVTYYFDDGYYNRIINCGYIVMNNYDSIKLNKECGETIIKNLSARILSSFKEVSNIPNKVQMYNDGSGDDMIVAYYDDELYDYIFRCRSTTSLSDANQLRKINNLPFYPYDSRMDKYGTYYIAAYARLKENVSLDKADINVTDKFIKKIVSDLFQRMNSNTTDIYHYEPMKIKRPVIYSERVDL